MIACLLENGGFQNPGVCLQAFPSLLFHFLALAPFFARQNTENPVPLSFFAPKPHGNACYTGFNDEQSIDHNNFGH